MVECSGSQPVRADVTAVRASNRMFRGSNHIYVAFQIVYFVQMVECSAGLPVRADVTAARAWAFARQAVRVRVSFLAPVTRLVTRPVTRPEDFKTAMYLELT